MSVGYVLQTLKLAAFAAFLGLLLVHWCSPLTAATVAVGVLFALLGAFA